MLRLSLEPHSDALPLRQGRAMGWIAEALEPMADEIGPNHLRSLVLAIRSATGIEALVWLTDVAGLSTQQGLAVMRWSAQAMLASTLAGNPPPTIGKRGAVAGIS